MDHQTQEVANHPTLGHVISGRERDLGSFSVHRVLPYMMHRMVGPFIFFDHMGPAVLPAGQRMTVRPHPHINLATVTYLFEGVIRHQDSLGSDQLIEPGAINWMMAGRGIVHSERTPESLRGQSVAMNGIQLWVALPEEFEESEPTFVHHPKHTLPSFEKDGVPVRLLLGKAFGHESPVKVHSDMFYADISLKAGQKFVLPSEGREIAVYIVEGSVTVEGMVFDPYSMAIAKPGCDLTVAACQENARIMVLGGQTLGKRHIFWNFVSSSKERIEEAKALWSDGPRATSRRFSPIPGDDKEFIPLPHEEPVKGTIM
ncbi:MAG: pirin family protein [Chitinophagaceae bacterium]|nr:pirin family protein [Oligoflexus sp.]